ncbi:MAG: phosphoadenosine phosphosulfate reductase family protein [Candidatus Nanoarchaeia archaeon]|nr:phosphoadenosine phosphosulfate reductase family protein [Candidatus Nanoarchaeia archaeon]MDD5741431.1 phosphoadenosine phosphosulfate reductase family protein [Candidatus Nanoarchaeia archaeon]
MVEQRFQKEFRTKKCEELMRPEVRALMDLPLDKKVEKSLEILREAKGRFKNIGIGFSGGTDSLVLLHLVLKVFPNTLPVIFSDTQHDHPETYEFIEKVKKEWNLKNFNTFKANQNRVKEFIDKFGLQTPEFTEICCEFHKIEPMRRGVDTLKLDALITGIRGVEHEERAKETIFSPRKSPKHIRVHPILFWRPADILEYVKKNNIECNPLYKQGYTSLGCMECTSLNKDPNAHERAGRGVARETIMEKLRALGYS